MPRYHLRASHTDPPCLTPEGEAMADRRDALNALVSRYLALADDQEAEDPVFSTRLREMAAELKDTAEDIEEKLEEDKWK